MAALKTATNRRLFVYGTLRIPAVMEALIGRMPAPVDATLPGYARYQLAEWVFPGIIESAGDSVDGLLYSDMAERELEIIDAFEDGFYARCLLQVDAGEQGTVNALAYTIAPAHAHLVQRDALWALERFVAEHGSNYVRQCAAFRAALDAGSVRRGLR